MDKKITISHKISTVKRLLLSLTTAIVLFLFSGRESFSQNINSDSVKGVSAIFPDSLIVDSTKLFTPNYENFDITTIQNDLLDINSSLLEIIMPNTSNNTTHARLEAPDTVKVVGGVMPFVRERELEAVFFSKKDSIAAKKVEMRRPFSELAKQRSPIFKRDTIAVNRLALYSVAVPGLSQLYNKQYWKIPILYGATAGFTVGAISFADKYKSAKGLYNDAIFAAKPAEEITPLRKQMDKYNTQKTVMMAGAALTYMYFLCDGAVNYKGDVHPTKKATILSALFPGAGQLYNQKYWKLPIVYGGFMTFIYIIDFNNRGYQRFKLAYELLADGDDTTVDEFNGFYSEANLQNTRDSYRRYRDLGIIMTAGFYLLQVIDAHVDAYLSRYDVSDELAMDIVPTIIDSPTLLRKGGYGSNGFGLGLRLKF